MFPIDRDFSAIGESLLPPRVDHVVSTDSASPNLLATPLAEDIASKVIFFEREQLRPLCTSQLLIKAQEFEAQVFRLVIREVVQDSNEAKAIANGIIQLTIKCQIEGVGDLLDTLDAVNIDFSDQLAEMRKGISCYTELASRFDSTLSKVSLSNPKKVRELAAQIITRHLELEETAQKPNLAEQLIDFSFQLLTKIVPMKRITDAIITQARREDKRNETNPYKVHAVRFLAEIPIGKFDSVSQEE